MKKKLVALAIIPALMLGGCSTAVTNASSASSSGDVVQVASSEGEVLDANTVHTIELEVAEDELRAMIQTYLDSGEKEWIEATVTIDGTTFENVGIKLKGNSTLRSITTETPAAELPLRIRLDKYVDGQNIDGISDFTVRSSSTETAMNEAVALDLLREAGLASEGAIATRFSVNGGEAELRLTVQNLDETWVEQNFPDAGADSVLYKADAEGSWAWKGEDGDYTSSFSVEAGDDDYAPLIELLDLVNNGTEEEIAEKLPQLLDVDSFATYLAFEEIIDNFDDIDGPGNNSYLFWDSATKKFTVVAWDHNSAFGVGPGAGSGQGPGGGQEPGGFGGERPEGAADGDAQGAMPGGEMPGGGTPPDGAMPENGAPGGGRPGTSGSDGSEGDSGADNAAGDSGNSAGPGDGFGGGAPGGGMPGGQSNPLTTAFLANSEWEQLVADKKTELTEELVGDGMLDELVTQWSGTLTDSASDLVSKDTVEQEADQIRSSAE
ncbi:MAG: CotH kinase family protein [Leucobacter sp.]